MDDPSFSKVLDLPSSVPYLPKQWLGMLADLARCSVDSWCQGELDQSAVTEVLAYVWMFRLNAQVIRFGVGMVRVKFTLYGFVGLDTADVSGRVVDAVYGRMNAWRGDILLQIT